MTDAFGPETRAIPAVQPKSPGWVLAGRYRVAERIGVGGMAEVFRAHDELLNRDIALKVFRTPVEEPGNPNGVERRRLELQALAHLSHPNLITLFDGSIAGDDTAYLVLELITGPNLAARLAEGPLPESQARELGAQIADALAYVHTKGMVHRDVKPANILLGTDGTALGDGTMRARLSDFGIVRLLGSARLTSVDLALGTASYLAPEQARGVDVGSSADVYSLGLVMIEALTGVRSFDGPPLEAVLARLTAPPPIPPGLPEPWPGLLAAMTATDPSARPGASEVARCLRSGEPIFSAHRFGVIAAGPTGVLPRIAGDAGPPPLVPAAAAVAPEGEVDERPRQRMRGVLLAAVVLIATIGTAGYLLVRPDAQRAAPGSGLSTTPAGPQRPASHTGGSPPSSGGVTVATRTSPAATSASATSATSPTPASADPSPSTRSSAARTSAKPSSTPPASSPSASITGPSTSPATSSAAATGGAKTSPGL